MQILKNVANFRMGVYIGQTIPVLTLYRESEVSVLC